MLKRILFLFMQKLIKKLTNVIFLIICEYSLIIIMKKEIQVVLRTQILLHLKSD